MGIYSKRTDTEKWKDDNMITFSKPHNKKKLN